MGKIYEELIMHSPVVVRGSAPAVGTGIQEYCPHLWCCLVTVRYLVPLSPLLPCVRHRRHHQFVLEIHQRIQCVEPMRL